MLRGLFKIKPEERLGFADGAAELKQHAFFKDIDFDKLLRKEVDPPINFEDKMKTIGE